MYPVVFTQMRFETQAICSGHLHHMLFEDFWPSDLKSQTH